MEELEQEEGDMVLMVGFGLVWFQVCHWIALRAGEGGHFGAYKFAIQWIAIILSNAKFHIRTKTQFVGILKLSFR